MHFLDPVILCFWLKIDLDGYSKRRRVTSRACISLFSMKSMPSVNSEVAQTRVLALVIPSSTSFCQRCVGK